MARKDLPLMEKAYNICDQLGLDDSDIDEIMEDEDYRFSYDLDWEKLVNILEVTLRIKECLGDKYSDCELNMDTEYSWQNDDFGFRVSVINDNDLDVKLCVIEDLIIVYDFDAIDDTEQTFTFDHVHDACDYAMHLK